MRAAGVLMLVLATAACDPAVPLPVSVREPSLEADDLAVMKGLLDDRVRPRAAAGIVESRFLVVDTTLALCERDVVAFGAPPGGCLESTWLEFVKQVLPPVNAREAMLDFQGRNVKRLPIGGPMGEGVSFISATLTDFVSGRELDQAHRGAIVRFSAPSYPAPRVAVIAYAVRHDELAAARLEQQPDGRWMVVPGGWSGAIE